MLSKVDQLLASMRRCVTRLSCRSDVFVYFNFFRYSTIKQLQLHTLVLFTLTDVQLRCFFYVIHVPTMLQSAYWCKDWDVSTSYLQSFTLEDAQAAARRRLASPWTWVVLLLLTAAVLLRKHRSDSVGRGKKRDTAQQQYQQQQQQRNGYSSSNSSSNRAGSAEYDVEGNRYTHRVSFFSFV
jgi:hypothetical protein